ncbi:MarR family winged helix-turn-helix transcriptional regulator [Agarilytica rhodophyticola]|uniref:MarR family winged helix-turn-helix transcriptional regulator n=1 Tax=Agarilytica rhodophyticola TaxID=1737490 RepID=UPI000CD9BE4C|nr:helix-turn-helix domain-containing protein [Agarilytica rhodophyticola]
MKYNAEEITLILLERLARVINNDAALSAIKPAQWEALRFFSQANRFSRTPSALTAYLGVTKGTVSQTINVLERKGLIQKVSAEKDRRSVSITLTQSGLSLLNDDPLKSLTDSIKQLNHNQVETFNQTLKSVLSSALKQREGVPFGACRTCKYFKENFPEGNPHQCSLLHVPLSNADSQLICREHAS